MQCLHGPSHRLQCPFDVIETLCIAKSCPSYNADVPIQLLESRLSVLVALGTYIFQALYPTVQANYDSRKSQLAIEYSYQVRESSPDMWVFWVHASSAAQFEKGYRKIAERVKIADRNMEANVLRSVNNWLCDESNGRWFMIIDSADDASVFSHPADERATGDKKAAVTKPLSGFPPQSQNGPCHLS
jgi:hypothetical protein